MKAETLKKSILQYAIQGKLVPQIPSEEPASILLQRIKKEKQELIKQGKLKKEKPLAPITDDEKSFDIPDSWQWVRYGTVANLHTGNSINAEEKKKKYTNLKEGYFYIGTKDVGFDGRIDYENGIKIPFSTSFEIAKNNATLLCIEGGSAGRKIAKLTQDVCFGNKLCAFESILIDPRYVYYSMQTISFVENFKSNLTGMIGGVGVNGLKTLLFPLPPLAEQQRIVTKIEELMVFVDKYEKYEKELELLEKQFPERLKKSILQYAIQGKLVPQIPSEEPASILLQKIKKEKQELIKQGKLKKEKPLAPITDDEKPFDIPDSWEWARLGRLCTINRGGSPRPIKNYITLKEGYNWIKIGDTIKGEKYITSTKEKIKKEGLHKTRFVEKGDFILSNSMSFGRPYILKIDGCIHDGWLALQNIKKSFNEFYLFYLLSSQFVFSQFAEIVSGAVVNNLNSEKARVTIIPLPPVAEQQRIVSKIEELFALVDLLAQGKRLSKDAKEELPRILPFMQVVAKQKVVPSNNFEEFELAARAQIGANIEAVEEAISQVKDYYGKKN